MYHPLLRQKLHKYHWQVRARRHKGLDTQLLRRWRRGNNDKDLGLGVVALKLDDGVAVLGRLHPVVDAQWGFGRRVEHGDGGVVNVQQIVVAGAAPALQQRPPSARWVVSSTVRNWDDDEPLSSR